MPEWLIWMLVAFFFMSFARGCAGGARGCSWGSRRYRQVGHDGESDDVRAKPRLAEPRRQLEQGRMTTAGAVDRLRNANTKIPEMRARPKETPLQELQRKFINDTITLEEYEVELDKLQGRY